jgi:hypothetical protein
MLTKKLLPQEMDLMHLQIYRQTELILKICKNVRSLYLFYPLRA